MTLFRLRAGTSLAMSLPVSTDHTNIDYRVYLPYLSKASEYASCRTQEEDDLFGDGKVDAINSTYYSHSGNVLLSRKDVDRDGDSDIETVNEYNSHDQLIRVRTTFLDRSEVSTSWLYYDDFGWQSREDFDYTTDGRIDFRVSYTYAPNGRLLVKMNDVRADSVPEAAMFYSYDSVGRLRRIDNDDDYNGELDGYLVYFWNHKMLTKWEAFHEQLSSEPILWGIREFNSKELLREERSYRIEAPDHAFQRLLFDYDSIGRVVFSEWYVDDHLESSESTTYDSHGRVLQKRYYDAADGNGVRTYVYTCPIAEVVP